MNKLPRGTIATTTDVVDEWVRFANGETKHERTVILPIGTYVEVQGDWTYGEFALVWAPEFNVYVAVEYCFLKPVQK